MKSIDINKFPYLSSPHTQLLFSTFEKNNIEAKFVGGCVREALLGYNAKDIDIAVNVAPEVINNVLKKANIKVIPTGLDHGTLTAIIGNQIFEITSLRIDHTTYGRHADVDFNASWYDDAQRRDFTINAIYLNMKGEIFDPCKGEEDLKLGDIKFIGDANKRICEDYLRILRFFRFHARFGSKAFDQEAIIAIKANLAGLENVSFERIRMEFMKILVAENSLRSLNMMQITGVTKSILPFNLQLKYYEQLVDLEQQFNVPLSFMRRLFIILPKIFDFKVLAKYLRLTRKEQYWLKSASNAIQSSAYTQPAHSQLYYLGKSLALDINLLAKSFGYANELEAVLGAMGNWCKPKMPITGNDLKTFITGKKVGYIMNSVELWWVENYFKPNYDDCIRHARSIIKSL